MGGTLKKLQVLKMDNSRFMKHIPTGLGNMRSMRYWDVKGSDGIDMYSEGETNAVSGSIPTQIGRLKHLLTFNMENNTLSGTIPVDIANMTSLQRCVLPDNKLSGTIPNIFVSMNMSLETWDTFNNKLTGDLPTSIAELANLEYLYVQNEHTDPLRNYYCKERISQNANGKKYNQIAMQKDYISMTMAGTCVNPLDVDGVRAAIRRRLGWNAARPRTCRPTTACSRASGWASWASGIHWAANRHAGCSVCAPVVVFRERVCVVLRVCFVCSVYCVLCCVFSNR